MLNAKKLREIEFKTIEILERFGFEEVHIPILEFSSDQRTIYIREDFTSEIAKTLQDRKVYYRGSILRTTSFGKPKEIYQVGCEIVRENRIERDDIVSCADVLNEVLGEIERFTESKVILMLGHYGLTASMLKENSDAFFRKNVTKISELVNSGAIDVKIARVFFKVLDNLEEIKDVIKTIPEDMEIFSSRIKVKKIYNLSEKVEKDYYDGLIFRGFLDGTRFLTGGKYKIGRREGIGFSLNLHSFEII